MRSKSKAEFVQAKPHVVLTTGKVIRMLRELKGWTQAELANRSGFSATNISLLENEKVVIGKKRVEQLAKAFGGCATNLCITDSSRAVFPEIFPAIAEEATPQGNDIVGAVNSPVHT